MTRKCGFTSVCSNNSSSKRLRSRLLSFADKDSRAHGNIMKQMLLLLHAEQHVLQDNSRVNNKQQNHYERKARSWLELNGENGSGNAKGSCSSEKRSEKPGVFSSHLTM